MTNDPKTAWKLQYGNTEIEFVCHETGEVYMCFNWNGTGVWEYVGLAGRKNFPNWLRKVADKMEQEL